MEKEFLFIEFFVMIKWDFPDGSAGKKNSTCNTGDVGLIPG